MNILMSLMSLDIGGAETHVFELSKELKRRGHNIIITSNGGAYVKDLEDAGIKHYQVPLQNKNPKNVAKAFSLLKKIITGLSNNEGVVGLCADMYDNFEFFKDTDDVSVSY